jgi:threonine dehydrogenase-like Zn-dependent dehydrogenase
MQAITVNQGKVSYSSAHPDPVPNGDEVLIEVELAGICATDLEIVKGYMNFSGILGHEFVGRVVKGPRNLTDKRVVGTINCVCGKCDLCLSGLSDHCRQRTVIGIDGRDGTFAEFLTLPTRNVHLVPDNVSCDEAVFVEPLAAALQIVQQIRIEPRDRIAVVGDGRLGLLTVQVLSNRGGKGNVVLVGKHEEKISFCEKRGIQARLLHDMLIKPEWDVVVDCTGSADGFATACRLVRPRGKLVLKSTWHADSPVDLSPLVINEINLIGSRCGPFPDALKTLSSQEVVVNGLITSRYKLSQGPQALEKAAAPNQIKVVLEK